MREASEMERWKDRDDGRGGSKIWNYESDTGTAMGSRRWTYVLIYRILPPFPYNLFSAFEDLPRFLNKVEEET